MPWNPLDWTAGPFLTLYISAASLVFLGGFALRSRIGSGGQCAHKLNLLELAYLAGGARRLGDAALFSLVSANAASIALKDDSITVRDQAPLGALIGQPTNLPVVRDMTRAEFQVAISPIVRRVQQRLEELGYAPTDDQMSTFYLTVLPFLAFILGFGAIKAWIGLARHHPIGILIVLLVLTVVAAFFLAVPPSRTRAGTNVLKNYKSSHARAARAPRDHELLLAVALTGATVLAGTAYTSVYAASRTTSSKGRPDGSGCGGGGGGCGGCSC